MRVLAVSLALLLTTGTAGAHLDFGLHQLAGTPRSMTGGAVLGPAPPDLDCTEATGSDTRCGERAALAAHVRREAEIARLSNGWDARAQGALARLRRAELGFAEAIARNEVDRRGSDHDDQAQAAADAQNERFVALLRRTTGETGRSIAVDLSPHGAKAAMDATLSLVMAEPIARGSVTRDGVRTTQQAWAAYRDAFVALAAALDRPTAPIEAELTSIRTRDLQGLIAD